MNKIVKTPSRSVSAAPNQLKEGELSHKILLAS